MTSDLDIWRSALLLVTQHGDDAVFVACGRIDAMIERGDPAGEGTWKRVLAAVRELRRPNREPGERLH